MPTSTSRTTRMMTTITAADCTDHVAFDPVMARLDPLRNPPIGFAHRGARSLAPENTLAACALALRLGATGLESDAWLTEDGVVVLDHDGVVGNRLRRRAILTVARADLPDNFPALADL